MHHYFIPNPIILDYRPSYRIIDIHLAEIIFAIGLLHWNIMIIIISKWQTYIKSRLFNIQYNVNLSYIGTWYK